MSEVENIPKHWRVKKLGEVCDIKGGKNQSNVINPNGKYPIYGSSGIFGYADEYLCDEHTTIIGRKGTINSPIYVTTKFWNVDTAFGLCSKADLNSKFLYFFCLGFNFHKLDKSTTIPSLAKRDLQSIDIPLPPFHEQLSIVSKIEELLSDLENGKQQLLIAQQQLKIYRQSLLKWAFEGRFGFAQRPSNSTKEGDLPKGWFVKKLSEIGTWKGGGTPSKSRNDFWENGNILWVSPKDMKSQKIFDTIDKITSDAIENSSTKLISKGSVLFVVRSGILRRTLPVALTITDVTVNQDIQALTPINVIPEYVYLYVCAKNDDIRKTCSKDGTTVESIESQLLKHYSIPLCSLQEQQFIVDELESKLTVCDKIEETISQSLLQAESLRQSILKKAFEGKLV